MPTVDNLRGARLGPKTWRGMQRPGGPLWLANPLFKLFVDPVRGGTTPTNATVYGRNVSMPTTITMSANPAGDVYVFGLTTLVIAATVTSIPGCIFVCDAAQVMVNKPLAVTGGALGISWYIGDQGSAYVDSNTTVPGGIMAVVGGGYAYWYRSALPVVTVVNDMANLRLNNCTGNVEFEVAPYCSMSAVDCNASGTQLNIYPTWLRRRPGTLTLNAPISPLTTTQRYSCAPDKDGPTGIVDITNSILAWGFNVQSGADLTMLDSNFALFDIVTAGATIPVLPPLSTPIANTTYLSGDKTIRLIRSNLWHHHIYQGGPVNGNITLLPGPGTGNITVTGPGVLNEVAHYMAAGVLNVYQLLTVDGTGGNATGGEGNGTIYFIGCVLQCDMTVKNNAVVIVQRTGDLNTASSWNTGAISRALTVQDNAILALEDVTLTNPPVATLNWSGTAAITRTQILSPAIGATIVGTSNPITGFAGRMGGAAIGWDHYVLDASQDWTFGSGVTTITNSSSQIGMNGSTGAAPAAAGTLGTWNTTGLAAGTWYLRLRYFHTATLVLSTILHWHTR